MRQHCDPLIEAWGKNMSNVILSSLDRAMSHTIRILWHFGEVSKGPIAIKKYCLRITQALLWLDHLPFQSLHGLCNGKCTFLEVPNIQCRKRLPSSYIIALSFPASPYSSSNAFSYLWNDFFCPCLLVFVWLRCDWDFCGSYLILDRSFIQESEFLNQQLSRSTHSFTTPENLAQWTLEMRMSLGFFMEEEAVWTTLLQI